MYSVSHLSVKSQATRLTDAHLAHFDMNGGAPGLALTERLQVTLKLAVDKRFTARIISN